MNQINLGFVGAGAMTAALVEGIVAAGVIGPGSIHVTNRSNHRRREGLAARFGIRVYADKPPLLNACGVIVLAVKPADVATALTEIVPCLRPDHLLVSVCAGTSLERLARGLGGHQRLVRAMPNTSCRVRESATVLAPGPGVDASDLELAQTIFTAVGRVLVLPETAIDPVTGLSGSGPAYVYLMLEALTGAGEAVGLPRQVAFDLATQTVYGAAKMVLESGEGPEALRRGVASPGGTTAAGLQALEQAGFTAALYHAVQSATRRSSELAWSNEEGKPDLLQKRPG